MVPGFFGKRNGNPFRVRHSHARRKLKDGTKVRLGSLFRFIPILVALMIATSIIQQSLRIAHNDVSDLSNLLNGRGNLEHPQKENSPSLKKIFKAKTAHQRESLRKARLEFQQLQDKLKPCDLAGDCRQLTSGPIYVKNNIPQSRVLCGLIIPGNGVSILQGFPDTCSNTRSFLFSPGQPRLSGDSMPPIELFWDVARLQLGDDKQLKTVSFPCSVPCRVNKQGWGNAISTISVKDTPWEIISTMEGKNFRHCDLSAV